MEGVSFELFNAPQELKFVSDLKSWQLHTIYMSDSTKHD